MTTINIAKVNVCDNCNKTKVLGSKKDDKDDIVKIQFNRTNKTIYLCEECAKNLLEGLKQILEV